MHKREGVNISHKKRYPLAKQGKIIKDYKI